MDPQNILKMRRICVVRRRRARGAFSLPRCVAVAVLLRVSLCGLYQPLDVLAFIYRQRGHDYIYVYLIKFALLLFRVMINLAIYSLFFTVVFHTLLSEYLLSTVTSLTSCFSESCVCVSMCSVHVFFQYYKEN